MGVFIVSLGFLVYLMMDLNRTNMALVLASGLGSVGTFALALATVYNVAQSSRSLEIREQEREKPLVRDVLSYVVEPAIDGLSENMQAFNESENEGCTFDWVYVDAPRQAKVAGLPRSVGAYDALAGAWLVRESPDLFDSLRKHDRMAEQIGEMGSEFHREMLPKIESLFDSDDKFESGDSLKPISSGVLKRLDHFGESSEYYEFWDKYGDVLIEYAETEPDVTIGEIEAAEEDYRELVTDVLEKMRGKKAELKTTYRVSEEEISDPFDEWPGW